MTVDRDVVVIGAGPAGLAAAARAEELGMTTVVLEKDSAPGGLLKSIRSGGFTFDLSGHLLHLQDQDVVDLIDVDEQWLEVQRRSACWVDGALIPYPFQQHLAFATERVRRECLATLPSEATARVWDSQDSLLDWIQAELGDGIARHFMIPYNEKLSTTSVTELSCQALGRFLPRPSLDVIRQGARKKSRQVVGYNSTFLYPRRGGIDLLVERLAGRCSDVRVRSEVVGLNPSLGLVRVADGSTFHARRGVVSTAPITNVSVWIDDQALRSAVGALRHNSVWCVNVGVRKREHAFAGLQWVYLPGPETSAYRVGFYDQIAGAMAPEGFHSIYVEIAHNGDLCEAEAVRLALSDLRTLGVIERRQNPGIVCPVSIPVAYVIQDINYSQASELARLRIEELGVRSIGRYGSWEYSSMEDAIKQGLCAAEGLANGA